MAESLDIDLTSDKNALWTARIRKNGVRTLYLTPTPPTSPLHPHFSFITDLTISSHVRSMCEQLDPIELPNLDTLRIVHGAHQHSIEVCRCRHSLPQNRPDSRDCPQCPQDPPCGPCPLLSGLDPRCVILGGYTTGLSGVGGGLTLAGMPFPGPNVKEIVIYAGLHTGRERNKDYSVLRTLPATVDKLTIILGVVEPQVVQRWADGSDVRQLDGDVHVTFGTGRARARGAQEALIQAGVSGAQVVEIMGLEAIRYPLEAGSKTWLKDCKIKTGKMVIKKLIDEGWTVKAARARAKDIVYKRWKGKAPVHSRFYY